MSLCRTRPGRSRRRAAALGVTLALAAAAAAACGSGGPPRVAATVEDVEIPSARVERLTTSWLGSEQSQALAAGRPGGRGASRDDSARLVLGFVIRSTFLAHLADQMGVDDQPTAIEASAPGEIPAAELDAMGWSKADLGQALEDARRAKAIAQQVFPTVAVSDVELREKYDGRASLFQAGWKAAVRVAYFDTAEAAEALRAAGATGEAFDAAATRSGARQVGTLSAVAPTSPLPAPVVKAIASLRAGQVSEPVPGGGGFLVVAVDHREDRPAVSFDAARADLVKLVEDQKRQSLFLEWFAKQLSKAAVEVDGHYGRWNASNQLVG